MPAVVQESVARGRKGSPRARAAAALRRRILRGSLRAGERLPAEDELAARLHVARGTLRMAIGVLECEGLIRRRRHHGCIVVGPRQPQPLLSNTAVLLSDIEGDIQPQLFGGHLRSINSGVFDATVAARLNFLSMYRQGDMHDTLTRLTQGRPLGVLVTMPTQHAYETVDLARQLADVGVPVVAFGQEPGFERLDRVVSDHRTGACQLVHWLARQGRKRIVRVWTNPAASWIKAHDQGYVKAMRELKLRPQPVLPVTDLLGRREGDRDNFDRRARQLLGFLIEALRGARGADAIMVGTDSDAYLVAAACRLLGIVPNRDVLIAGYDDYWRHIPERQWEPCGPAATVDKQNHRIGQAMVQMLVDRVAGRLPGEAQCTTIPQRLVLADEPELSARR